MSTRLSQQPASTPGTLRSVCCFAVPDASNTMRIFISFYLLLVVSLLKRVRGFVVPPGVAATSRYALHNPRKSLPGTSIPFLDVPVRVLLILIVFPFLTLDLLVRVRIRVRCGTKSHSMSEQSGKQDVPSSMTSLRCSYPTI